MNITVTELDRLADAFVFQDPNNVRSDAKENGVESTASHLRSMASEQGGHWEPLDSIRGEQALADAIVSLLC